MLIEKTAGVYVSEDNGESWSSREASWLRELRERYISSMAIGPDGSVALIYILSGEEGEDDSYRSVGLYVDPDGNQTTVEAPNGETLCRFSFGNDGRLYGSTMEYGMYVMDPVKGEAERLYHHLWIYTHGIAALCATGMCRFTREGISKMMTEVFVSLLKNR